MIRSNTYLKHVARCLAVSALVLAAIPATAQDTPTDKDLAALRYFVTAGDTEAAAAETRRLTTLFPGTDIDAIIAAMTAGPEIDTTPIWDRINADDFAGARAAIDATRRAAPEWTPPQHLMNVLAEREGQARLDTAFDAQDLGTVLEIAQATPELMACGRINNPWRLAELAGTVNGPAAALGIYQSVLATCPSEAIVVTTLQKASAHADKDQMSALFDTAGQIHPAYAQTLAALKDELMGPPAKAGTPAPAPAAPTGPVARAAALAKREDFAGCLSALSGQSSAAAELQRGWCAHNLGQYDAATKAFSAAEAKGNASQAREAKYGQSLVLIAAGKPGAAERVVKSAPLTSGQSKVVNKALLGAQANEAFQKGQYRQTLQYLDEYKASVGPLSRGQLMLQGWSYHNLGERAAAMQVFSAVQESAPGPDSLRALGAARRGSDN
ncbi:hypothetical protein LA6_000695 [Marinibacterium anthonyi]|nr:hypothetical protein LA6_000695 [Marinibacterium anthonyi]